MTVYDSFKVLHEIAAGISAGQDINALALDSLARGLTSEKNGASGRSLFLFGAGFAAGAYYLYATREGEGRSDSSEVT